MGEGVVGHVRGGMGVFGAGPWALEGPLVAGGAWPQQGAGVSVAACEGGQSPAAGQVPEGRTAGMTRTPGG